MIWLLRRMLWLRLSLAGGGFELGESYYRFGGRFERQERKLLEGGLSWAFWHEGLTFLAFMAWHLDYRVGSGF